MFTWFSGKLDNSSQQENVLAAKVFKTKSY